MCTQQNRFKTDHNWKTFVTGFLCALYALLLLIPEIASSPLSANDLPSCSLTTETLTVNSLCDTQGGVLKGYFIAQSKRELSISILSVTVTSKGKDIPVQLLDPTSAVGILKVHFAYTTSTEDQSTVHAKVLFSQIQNPVCSLEKDFDLPPCTPTVPPSGCLASNQPTCPATQAAQCVSNAWQCVDKPTGTVTLTVHDLTTTQVQGVVVAQGGDLGTTAHLDSVSSNPSLAVSLQSCQTCLANSCSLCPSAAPNVDARIFTIDLTSSSNLQTLTLSASATFSKNGLTDQESGQTQVTVPQNGCTPATQPTCSADQVAQCVSNAWQCVAKPSGTVTVTANNVSSTQVQGVVVAQGSDGSTQAHIDSVQTDPTLTVTLQSCATCTGNGCSACPSAASNVDADLFTAVIPASAGLGGKPLKIEAAATFSKNGLTGQGNGQTQATIPQNGCDPASQPTCPANQTAQCVDNAWQCVANPPTGCDPANQPTCPANQTAQCVDNAWQCVANPPTGCDPASQPTCSANQVVQCVNNAWQCVTKPSGTVTVTANNVSSTQVSGVVIAQGSDGNTQAHIDGVHSDPALTLTVQPCAACTGSGCSACPSLSPNVDAELFSIAIPDSAGLSGKSLKIEASATFSKNNLTAQGDGQTQVNIPSSGQCEVTPPVCPDGQTAQCVNNAWQCVGTQPASVNTLVINIDSVDPALLAGHVLATGTVYQPKITDIKATILITGNGTPQNVDVQKFSEEDEQLAVPGDSSNGGASGQTSILFSARQSFLIHLPSGWKSITIDATANYLDRQTQAVKDTQKTEAVVQSAGLPPSGCDPASQPTCPANQTAQCVDNAWKCLANPPEDCDQNNQPTCSADQVAQCVDNAWQCVAKPSGTVTVATTSVTATQIQGIVIARGNDAHTQAHLGQVETDPPLAVTVQSCASCTGSGCSACPASASNVDAELLTITVPEDANLGGKIVKIKAVATFSENGLTDQENGQTQVTIPQAGCDPENKLTCPAGSTVQCVDNAWKCVANPPACDPASQPTCTADQVAQCVDNAWQCVAKPSGTVTVTTNSVSTSQVQGVVLARGSDAQTQAHIDKVWTDPAMPASDIVLQPCGSPSLGNGGCPEVLTSNIDAQVFTITIPSGLELSGTLEILASATFSKNTLTSQGQGQTQVTIPPRTGCDPENKLVCPAGSTAQCVDNAWKCVANPPAGCDPASKPTCSDNQVAQCVNNAWQCVDKPKVIEPKIPPAPPISVGCAGVGCLNGLLDPNSDLYQKSKKKEDANTTNDDLYRWMTGQISEQDFIDRTGVKYGYNDQGNYVPNGECHTCGPELRGK